jgi:branched-subunit amino acid transport protein
MMNFLTSMDRTWWTLLAAALGTYGCRALGVKLSGHMSTQSEVFKWLSCVTYAMVAALTIRLIVMPTGLLGTVPLWARLLACGAALVVMVSRPAGRLVLALLTGTLLILFYAFFLHASP